MAKIISELIKSVDSSSSRAGEISRVLEYLGYEDEMTCIFSTAGSRGFRKSVDGVSEIFENNRDEGRGRVLNRLIDQFIFTKNDYFSLMSSDEDRAVALGYINKIKNNKNNKPRIEVRLSRGGVNYSGDATPEESLALINTGLAKLRGLSIKKKSQGHFNISDASSGEQSVVMSLLGISSQIEDNSLICIDEPEICLHPEWQEKYIHLLIETFSGFKGCQFIIATHSPQIVAELPQTNCFVMSMEDGVVRRAEELSNRSIDFQLANVFRTPGKRNEYLNRVAIGLFSRVSKNKAFSDRDVEDMKVLDGVYERIDKVDPLLDLISALKMIWVKYGRD